MPDALADSQTGGGVMTQKVAQRRLALLWFSGFGLLFLIMAIQVVADRYQSATSSAVGWFFPTTIPVSTLMIGVLVAQAMGGTAEARAADVFVYRLALTMLAVYLLMVGFTIVYATAFTVRPAAVFDRSNYVLGPAQGLVTAALGAFFARQVK